MINKRKILEKLYRTNGDIISILDIAEEIGWNGVKEINLYRVLYISSVLYSFKYPDKINIFSMDYDFVISLRGPFSDSIKNSLIYLRANKVITLDQSKEFILNKNNKEIFNIEKMPYYLERRSWLETIIYILAIYGEEKVYDFVFRDPEYQDSVQRNSITKINLDKGNETYKSLMSLKSAFENTLGEKVDDLDNKRYLELYFQYIFSKILRGETD